MSKYSPKFRLKQKVICYFNSSNKPVYGRVIGIKLLRGYKAAGLYQSGGMSTLEIERKGFPLAYCDNVDTCEYTVVYEVHGSVMTEKYMEETLIRNRELETEKNHE